MKVLHYVNENNLTWARSWLDLLLELGGLGVENHVVCKPGGTLGALLDEAGLPHTDVEVRFAALPALAFSFAKTLDKIQPDIIHTRLSSAAAIGGWHGKKRGIPVISTLDKFAKLKYYTNADLMVACSAAVQNDIIEKGFTAEKTAVVHNAVNCGFYEPNASVRAAKRAELGMDSKTLVFIAAGRFDDGKGFPLLVEAHKKIMEKCGAKTRLILA